MIPLSTIKSMTALLLLLALFGARMNTVTHSVFVVPLQAFIAQSEFIADAETKPRMAHLKANLHGADVPVPCADFVFVERVFESRVAFPPLPVIDLPEGHVTIFIPPA